MHAHPRRARATPTTSASSGVASSGTRRVDRVWDAVRAQPRPHQRGVVVARHEDDLALGAHARADRAQHRPRERGRVAAAPGQQLDDVAEQHEPVDVVERGEQRRERAAGGAGRRARAARRGAGRR